MCAKIHHKYVSLSTYCYQKSFWFEIGCHKEGAKTEIGQNTLKK